MNIITVGCGTTNTRVVLWKDDAIVASCRSEAGVRDTARTGSADFLAQAMGECLRDVIRQVGILPSDVATVVASEISNLPQK